MTQEVVALSAVTVDTTSPAISVEGYSKVGIQFKAASITSGNGVFTVEGTVNGVDFVALATLITNTASTSSQTITRVASVTLSSNTTALVWLDPHVALKAIRVKVDMTTDGAYSAHAIAST
jgi:hypothetical protein